MKKYILLFLLTLFLAGCQKEEPVAEAPTETIEIPDEPLNETEDKEAESEETWEKVRGYYSITWWDLISDEEAVYFEELNEAFTKDPNYQPEKDPPTPKVNEKINGLDVRIPGYIVGVDSESEDFSKVSSFLFVPYQGACIHVPPPPENQTIFVEVDEPVQSDPYMGYWLYGTIEIEEGSNDLASYYYTFRGDKLEFYF